MLDGIIESLVRSFVDEPPSDNENAVAERMEGMGWKPVRSNSAGGWCEYSYRKSSAYEVVWSGGRAVEALIKISWPEDGEDRDASYGSFETSYRQLVADLAAIYGEPALESEFDEPRLPIPGQFDRGAVWQVAQWNVAASFQQEDKDAPLRVSLWIYRLNE